MAVWVSRCLGLAQQSENLPVSIYPNPSHGTFYIDLAQDVRQMTCTIVNILGEEIYHVELKESDKNEIILPPAKGLYILKLVDAKKQLLAQRKIIVD